MVSSEDKKIKQFSTVHKRESIKEESRKKIARELEIDEDLLR